MKNPQFDLFRERLSIATDEIDLKKAIRSERKGSKKIRDYFVFLKMALNESVSYFSVIQLIILFMALTPTAIENINLFFLFFRIPITLDITFSSIVSFFIIILISSFGIVSYRFFGLTRSANEVSSRYSPGQFLLFKELQDIKEKLEKLDSGKK